MGPPHIIDVFVVFDEAIGCDLLMGKLIFQINAQLCVNLKCVKITRYVEEKHQIMSINIPYNELNIGAPAYTNSQ